MSANPASVAASTETVEQLQTTVRPQSAKARSERVMMLLLYAEVFHQTEPAEMLVKATTTALSVNPARAAAGTETAVTLQTIVRPRYVRALSEGVMIPLQHVEAFHQTEPAETLTKATTTATSANPASAAASSATAVLRATTVRPHRVVSQLLVTAQAAILLPALQGI
jgi:lipopolysaccharide export system protein LptC